LQSLGAAPPLESEPLQAVTKSAESAESALKTSNGRMGFGISLIVPVSVETGEHSSIGSHSIDVKRRFAQVLRRDWEDTRCRSKPCSKQPTTQ